jgi:hypothetical protein
MSPGGAVLTFLSVFVAALLAFYLDGLRERRATRRWVRGYLGFWRGTLENSRSERERNDAMLESIDSALELWLAAADGGPEPSWPDVDAVNVNNSITFTPLLMSGGVDVVPAALMRQMFVADATGPALRATSEVVTRLFEAEVRPLALGRVVDLSAAQRRGVELYRAEFRRLRALLRDYGVTLEEILDELARAGF